MAVVSKELQTVEL